MKNTERETDPVIGVIKKMKDEGQSVEEITGCMLQAGFNPAKFSEGIEEFILRAGEPIN